MERLDVERLIGSSYADVMIDVDEENGEVVVRLVLLYDRLFGAMSFFFSLLLLYLHTRVCSARSKQVRELGYGFT